MIDNQEVLEIHQILIREFGGSQGVRDEKYNFVIAVASGQLDFQQIITWIKQRTTNK